MSEFKAKHPILNMIVAKNLSLYKL